MQSALDPEPHHRLLHHKLTGSFGPTYLTALSVIQGVALASLASVVVSGYQQFTIVQWILVVISFGGLIAIWNQYISVSLLWDWIPDIRDTIFPFLIGAGELALNQTIALNLSAWLLVLASLNGVGALGLWNSMVRIKEEEENARLMSLVDKWIRWQLVYNLVGTVIALLCAIILRVANVQVTDGVQTVRGVFALGLVLLIGAGFVGFFLLIIHFWRRIVAYARTGRMSGR